MSRDDAAGPILRVTSAEMWRQLEPVIDAALDAPESDREAVVLARCGDDPELREAALAWMRACEREHHALEDALHVALLGALRHAADAEGKGAGESASNGDAVRSKIPTPGTRVGPWRLVEEIGRGGMGTVFLAERADAELPMRAALKFMHGSVAFDSVGIRRFRDERRILAALDHPAIARILDGGVDDGLPWFAMEYVSGAPIDVWCDARTLPVEARLRLFCRVCDAVQHAHARLVVHRDLKPANILVSASGDPKLLDFGIAKLLAAGDVSDAALTHPGAQPMTFAYAAPEQLRGDQPSTATDVYALGILLHVLLTGLLPLKGGGADGPSHPSTAVSRTQRHLDDTEDPGLPVRMAAARGATPPQLARRLRGDLDIIVARATDRDPGRRYASADALAADVQRHLDGQPVLARADTVWYRMRKLVVRHPVGSAATIIGGAVLLTFAVLTAVQASRLRVQSSQLIIERDKAAEVTSFLSGVLASADPYQPGGRVPTLREVLDRGAERATTFDDRPEIHAHLLSAMAPAYFGLGDVERAGALAREAVAIRRRILGPWHPELAASLVYLANVRLNQERADEAEAHAREALAIARRANTSDPDTAHVLRILGSALQRQGKLAEAEAVLRDVLTAERGRRPTAPLELAGVARSLGHVLRDQRRFADAAPFYAEAHELHRGAFGDEHPESANSAVNLGYIRFLLGDAVAGESLIRSGVDTKRRLLGITHPDVAGDQLTLARVLVALDRHDEAAALRREAEAVLAGQTNPP